jgi:phage-related protein
LGIKDTLKDIEQTNNNIDQIKKSFEDVMDKLAVQVANSFSGAMKDPFK